MQVDAIRKYYPDAIIREEKISGTKKKEDRPVLHLMLDMIGKGDKLVVWKLDRLGRNLKELLDIVELLEGKGASVEILDQKIDTESASGKAFLQMLGVFAEFETNLRRERQMAGIEKAKNKGVYKGRPEKYDREEFKRLLDEGARPCDVMRRMGMEKSTFYKIRSALATAKS